MRKRKDLWVMTIFCAAVLLSGCSGLIRQTLDIEKAMETTEYSEKTMTTEIEVSEIETAGNETEKTVETEIESETKIESEITEDAVVIVLDPGHDDEYCQRNHPDLEVNEQDLNLAIGLACRERLEQYQGVKVYMTREDGSCPDAENGGEYCIEARTGYAAELNADLFVSLHNNGTTGVYGAEANGTEVYVSNYSAYTEEGRKLGEMILDNLSKLDLSPKGVFVRTKEEKGYYDDGSVQDWYYLISYSVEGGHPGIIIEHAYMDNPHDNAILKDAQKLKEMGIADADAIAAYYGLQLK